VTDAKEVGVGNPAEETFYHPNARIIAKWEDLVKPCFAYYLRLICCLRLGVSHSPKLGVYLA
jgi:hypothetical protein